MVSATQLLEEHQNDFNDRPKRIQILRNDIRRLTGLEVPRGLADVPDWYRRHKSVITKELNKRIGGSGGDEE